MTANTPAELKVEIEKIRPQSKLVTIERREQLVELLNLKFNRNQLYDYWSSQFLEKLGANRGGVSMRKGMVKAKVIDGILDEIWEITAVASKEGAEDVLVKKTLKVDRRDMYFLIRQGKILILFKTICANNYNRWQDFAILGYKLFCQIPSQPRRHVYRCRCYRKAD